MIQGMSFYRAVSDHWHWRYEWLWHWVSAMQAGEMETSKHSIDAKKTLTGSRHVFDALCSRQQSESEKGGWAKVFRGDMAMIHDLIGTLIVGFSVMGCFVHHLSVGNPPHFVYRVSAGKCITERKGEDHAHMCFGVRFVCIVRMFMETVLGLWNRVKAGPLSPFLHSYVCVHARLPSHVMYALPPRLNAHCSNR